MKATKGKLANAQLLLNALWALFSLVLLLIVFYFIGEKERLETQQSLYYAADEVADNVDNLVDDILQSIYTVVGKDFKTCNANLLSGLQHIVFNNPDVSAILIKDNHGKTICGTLTQGDSTIIDNTQRLVLFGPVKLTKDDNPAFIVQQRIGSNYVQAFILEDVLKRALIPTTRIAQWVGLYNIPQRQVIFHVRHNLKNKMWEPGETTTSLPHHHETASLLKMNLNLDSFQVILLADPEIIRQHSWYHELWALVILLFVAIAIYLYLRRAIQKHFSLHRALENAIKNDNFFPMYQPIFDSEANTFCGAEVLLRWRTDDQDIIMPDLFISDAEESGLIIPITLQLIEKTLDECSLLLQENKNFHLAFNLSAVHFTKDGFLNSFYSLCKRFQIPARQIMLEITERDLLRQDDLTFALRIKELREEGFSVAVDDFGTGHASISYLQHFSFNFLKIDQLFVSAIGTGAITETLNKSIIQMAKNLKLNIIAEGVETFAQQEFLQEHGVTLMQGWYYAKAMPLEQLAHFIKGVHDEQTI